MAVVVYWNGNSFGEAVQVRCLAKASLPCFVLNKKRSRSVRFRLQHFYNKNPQLCGSFDGSCVDFNTCTLETPSGYCTHWTTPDEAEEILRSKGLEKIDLVERGRGVLAVFRQRR